MDKFSKIIRIISVPPLLAFLAATLLFFFRDGFFAGWLDYAVVLLTLVILPILPYPISLIKPKEKRRDFQRSWAIVFSVAGYISGTLFAFITNAPVTEKIFFSAYLLSGIAIAVASFVIKKKASGHTCGISGPITLLTCFLDIKSAFLYFLLIPVCYASVKLKRHTLPQLISGALIPIASIALSFLIFM